MQHRLKQLRIRANERKRELEAAEQKLQRFETKQLEYETLIGEVNSMWTAVEGDLLVFLRRLGAVEPDALGLPCWTDAAPTDHALEVCRRMTRHNATA